MKLETFIKRKKEREEKKKKESFENHAFGRFNARDVMLRVYLYICS